MQNTLEIQVFLAHSAQVPVLDVRSEGEYAQGHIPGAHNLPLFTNEERAVVGTLYKQKGRDSAILKGLDLVGPKMSEMVKTARKLAVNSEILVHCWRGGMRSGSICWLLNTAGIKASTLHKGYKAYRNFVLEGFEKEAQLMVLGGETGSGKTEILKCLKEKGEQVIDLEGIAHHKGSSFGAIGQLTQPTSEQFENNIAKEWNALDLSKRVWVEDESKNIGKVFLPDAIWNRMKVSPIVRVKIPKSERIKRLVSDYGKADKSELKAAIVRIEKRLGGLAYKNALEALENGRLDEVADLTLAYYDKAYNYNHEKRKFEGVHFVELEMDDPQLNAQRVIEFANKVLGRVIL